MQRDTGEGENPLPWPPARAIVQGEGGTELCLVIYKGTAAVASLPLDPARVGGLAAELLQTARLPMTRSAMRNRDAAQGI